MCKSYRCDTYSIPLLHRAVLRLLAISSALGCHQKWYGLCCCPHISKLPEKTCQISIREQITDASEGLLTFRLCSATGEVQLHMVSQAKHAQKYNMSLLPLSLFLYMYMYIHTVCKTTTWRKLIDWKRERGRERYLKVFAQTIGLKRSAAAAVYLGPSAGPVGEWGGYGIGEVRGIYISLSLYIYIHVNI